MQGSALRSFQPFADKVPDDTQNDEESHDHVPDESLFLHRAGQKGPGTGLGFLAEILKTPLPGQLGW